MPLRLRSYDRCPPGQFSYEQNGKKFGSNPDVRELARKVAAFRRGNNLPRASAGDALEDIDAYTCARIGNLDEWVYDTDVPFGVVANTVLPQSSPCVGCGATIT